MDRTTIPTKIRGALLAVVLVPTGVATAMPGSAPAAADTGQADDYGDERGDAEGEHEDDDSEAAENEHAATESDADQEEPANGSAVAAEHRTGVGPAGEDRTQTRHEEAARERAAIASQTDPPVDMPDQVLDFVSESQGVIGDFLSGDFTGDLGAAISDLPPRDGGAGNESTSVGSESTSDGDPPQPASDVLGTA